MPDEEQNEAETGEEQRQEEANQPTVEEIARKIGYRAKDEMKDPSKHVDAATYIERTAKFNDAYRTEIKHLKKSIDGIASTFKQVTEQKYNEGIAAAEAAAKQAKVDYDFEAFEKFTRQAAELKAQKAAAPAATGEPPEVSEFIERNPWFEQNKAMTADALDYREKYLRANPDSDLADVLEYVEKRIRKDYPEKFEKEAEKRKEPAAGPEGARPAGGGGREPWEKQEKELSDYERRTMEAMCKQMHNGKPIMTKKQYIENLASSGRFGR